MKTASSMLLLELGRTSDSWWRLRYSIVTSGPITLAFISSVEGLCKCDKYYSPCLSTILQFMSNMSMFFEFRCWDRITAKAGIAAKLNYFCSSPTLGCIVWSIRIIYFSKKKAFQFLFSGQNMSSWK